MSNGIGSLGAAASVNAGNAFSTKLDVFKKSKKIDADYLLHTIRDVLETREEIINSSSTHSLVDAILKPIGAAVGFYFGGSGGAAAGWSGVDAATDFFFGATESRATPETRPGMDLAAKHHMQAPGTNFGQDAAGWAQEAYQVYSLASGIDERLAKSGKSFGKAGLQPKTAPIIVDPISKVKVDPLLPIVDPSTITTKGGVTLTGQKAKTYTEKMKKFKAGRAAKASEDTSFFDFDKFFEEFQIYPARKAVNGFKRFELARPMIT